MLKNFVDGADSHTGEFVETDGLMLCRVQSSKEDVNGLEDTMMHCLKLATKKMSTYISLST